MSIRIGILGYGNLGRGVECAVEENPDMELVAVFTRRDPSAVKIWSQGVPVVNVKDVAAWQDKIDVMILCGGSATDLPKQTPEYAKYFNVIDSFDTHARIPEHFADVDKAAKESGHLGIISVGWDPGLFSLARVYSNAILPDGKDYTFWGKGVSQGHSDAIRRIKGVKDAKQYTVPVESAVRAQIRSSRRGRSTRVSASSCSRTALMPLMSRTPSRRCRTTLMSTTRRYTSSAKRSSSAITAASHTAASSSARALRATRRSTSTSSSSR